jgi:hypothetical protein
MPSATDGCSSPVRSSAAAPVVAPHAAAECPSRARAGPEIQWAATDRLAVVPASFGIVPRRWVAAA